MASREKEPAFTFKILLLGDGFVGKTSLVNRYVRNTFTKRYLHTIGMEPSFRNENVNGTYIRLQLFDIAGEKSFKGLREMFYRGAKGGLIVFDLTRSETLESVKIWYNEARKKTKNAKFILIGNKNDLTNQRQVTKKEAIQMKDKLQLLDYKETSALTGKFVEQAFKKLSKLILREIQK